MNRQVPMDFHKRARWMGTEYAMAPFHPLAPPGTSLRNSGALAASEDVQGHHQPKKAANVWPSTAMKLLKRHEGDVIGFELRNP